MCVCVEEWRRQQRKHNDPRKRASQGKTRASIYYNGPHKQEIEGRGAGREKKEECREGGECRLEIGSGEQGRRERRMERERRREKAREGGGSRGADIGCLSTDIAQKSPGRLRPRARLSTRGVKAGPSIPCGWDMQRESAARVCGRFRCKYPVPDLSILNFGTTRTMVKASSQPGRYAQSKTTTRLRGLELEAVTTYVFVLAVGMSAQSPSLSPWVPSV